MSKKRQLSEYEIESILSFIIPQQGIPIETAMSVVNSNKNKLKQQLIGQMIYPEMIPQLKNMIEKQYNESLIQAGESVGVVSAQSIGEKQTQTSVVYDEKIMIKHNEQIIITTVGEYIDNEMKYGIVFEIEANAFVKPLDLDKGIQILTVSQEEKMEWKHISELSRHPVNGNLVKITTQSGRQVTTTLSHSHLKKYNDSIIPVLGSDLKIGDRIPVAKKIPDLSIYNNKNLEEYINIWSSSDLIQEIIPYDIVRHITAACYKLNIKEYELKQDISRDILGKIINKLKETSKQQNINIDNELHFMELSYNSHIVWDKIVNIDIIHEKQYKHQYVYDFSVKDNETFTLLSGIVVHNTLNSVDWTDKVLYIVDGKTKVEPIGQIIDRLLDNNDNKKNIKLYQENKTEYLELSDGYYIPSGDENGFNDWLKIEAVTRHLPCGKLVKVVTQSGRTVMASQSKSFLVWDGNKFIDTLGSDVKIGDILPTTKNLIKPNMLYEHLDLFTIFPNVTLNSSSNDFVCPIPNKIPLDNDFGFFVGVYLARGWSTNTFIGIMTNDVNITKRITYFCNRYRVTYHIEDEDKYLTINSIILSRLLDIICRNINIKIIPEFVYTSTAEFTTGLIDGYFSCNAIVKNKNGYIKISFSSEYEQLIQGVSFLLSYMGIFGKITKNKLSIRNEYVKKFSTKIRLTEVNKQRLLEQIIINESDLSQTYYPKNRDVYFDAIKSIEYVESTNGLVYDFTVAKTRNFNLFNGLNIRDTFHKAGSGEKTVTTGVPRVEEILNATKDPRSVNCIVYTKKHHKSIAELRKTIGYNVVELTFAKITKEYKIEMDKKPEPWYEAFKIIYGDEFTKFTDCVSLQLDMDILYEYKLDMIMISDIISKNYSDMICVYSPDNIGQLDVFVDTSNIDLPENRLEFINSDNAKEIYLEEVVQPILYKIIICGVPCIDTMYFNDDPNNFETYGSNFKKLLGLPFVDYTKTVSNDVWDIYNTLGIEAARQFLIEEFMQLCSGINICHIQLLAEKMTYTGSILSISRYTMRNEDCGPMGKASFEETMDNFLKAGAYGQKEATRGVSASIICGKRANIGTGVCELIIDVKALPNSVHVLNDVKENVKNISKNIKSYSDSKIESKDIKKFEKKLEKKRNKIESESDEETDKVIQLTEKDFQNCTYKAKVYFGNADIHLDSEINEDGFTNNDEGLNMSFDSKLPQEVTLTWKDGIKVGKEIFSGFNSTHGVYTLLDGVDLVDQGRFMRIINTPIKIQQTKTSTKTKSNTKTSTKTKSNTKPITTNNIEQMDYLDF